VHFELEKKNEFGDDKFDIFCHFYSAYLESNLQGYSFDIFFSFAGGPRRLDTRQRKRWTDDISEWTGMAINNEARVAEDRVQWRGHTRRQTFIWRTALECLYYWLKN